MGKSRSLIIGVHSASGLKNRKSRIPGAVSDPYVIVCLDGRTTVALAQTEVAKNTLNPVWQSSFHVDVGRAVKRAGGRTPRVLSFVVCDAGAGFGSKRQMGVGHVPFSKIIGDDVLVESEISVDTGGSLSVTVASRSEAKTSNVVKPSKTKNRKNGELAAAALGGAGAAALAGAAVNEVLKKKKKKKSHFGGGSSSRYGYGYDSDEDQDWRRREEAWWAQDSDDGSSSSSDDTGSSDSGYGYGSDSSSGSSSDSDSDVADAGESSNSSEDEPEWGEDSSSSYESSADDDDDDDY